MILFRKKAEIEYVPLTLEQRERAANDAVSQIQQDIEANAKQLSELQRRYSIRFNAFGQMLSCVVKTYTERDDLEIEVRRLRKEQDELMSKSHQAQSVLGGLRAEMERQVCQ